MTVAQLRDVLNFYEDHLPVHVVVDHDGQMTEYTLSSWRFAGLEDDHGMTVYLSTKDDLGVPFARCVHLLGWEGEDDQALWQYEAARPYQ